MSRTLKDKCYACGAPVELTIELLDIQRADGDDNVEERITGRHYDPSALEAELERALSQRDYYYRSCQAAERDYTGALVESRAYKQEWNKAVAVIAELQENRDLVIEDQTRKLQARITELEIQVQDLDPARALAIQERDKALAALREIVELRESTGKNFVAWHMAAIARDALGLPVDDQDVVE